MSGQIAPNCRSEGKGCSGTPVVGFSVVRRLKTYLQGEDHEHPGKTYQGSAGNASPGRGVAKHLAGLPQSGYLPLALLRRARFARFRQTVSVESADDRGGCAQRPGAAVLRGAQRGDRAPAHGQWQRILRPSRWPSLRALLGDPANRTSAYRHRLAGNQRLLRTFSPHRERGILRRGFPQNVLRIAGAVAARPRCVPGVLQPRTRPPGLSHPGPHAVSNLVRRGCTSWCRRSRHRQSGSAALAHAISALRQVLIALTRCRAFRLNVNVILAHRVTFSRCRYAVTE